MASHPLISIIVTAYNEEKSINECVSSILNQSFKDFELIVIDDFSTDSTASILSSLCHRHSKPIQHVTNPSNIGLGLSRNKGLDLAIGKYAMFIDGDDWLEGNALTALASMTVQDNDIIFMNHNLCYKGGVCEPAYQAKLLIDQPEENLVTLKSRLLRVFHTAWNKIYKRKFLLNNKLTFPKGNYEDLVFSYSAILLSSNIGVCNQALYNYRQHPDTVPGRPNRKSNLVNNDIIFSRYETLFTFLYETKNFEQYGHTLYTKMLNQYSAILSERLTGTPKKQRAFFIKMQKHANSLIVNKPIYFSIKDIVNIFLIRNGYFLLLISINRAFTMYKQITSPSVDK